MSSFPENTVAADMEIAESQVEAQMDYGTGGDDNGVTAPDAPPNTTETEPATTYVSQPENSNVVMDDNGVIAPDAPPTEPATTQPENSNVVMDDQKIDNGADAVYAPLTHQPEAVASELAEAVPSGVVNNNNDEKNGNESDDVMVTENDDPNAFGNIDSNQFVSPNVVGVTPSAVSNQDTEVVNYQNNGSAAVGEAVKRKRGRPRKYPVTTEGASTVPVASPSLVNSPLQAKSLEKRGRGRPAGSGKKHKAGAPSSLTLSPAISGLSIGAAFTPYFITVRSGEYVQPKLLSLSQVDKQVVCVLSASGNLSTVTLQQPSSSGGTVTYQGCFEILSLSGSYLLSESGGRRSTTGGLSVTLAVPNGCIFGGGVAGPLIAGSDVQIFVGTFLASEQHLTTPRCNEVLTAPANYISSAEESPPSRALLSEPSGAGGNPYSYSNGVLNNGNQEPVPKVAWM
ncbi:AT-hook motif nuclear-localized protein 7 [Daucus carota subsp. sativus]|uniref:AT-hook motif nuclear-localized protein 7 n=1 Tax=Daucus carota subsp. sativus TaxID=79200 RepID=UPI0007EF8682|nr:PREDICTED: AT-hook motif nuclear-localized protein 7-like [Daucus carota subsp. sativus]